MKSICILLSLLLAAAAFPAGSLSVKGAVKTPGAISATDGLRLRDAIKQAGGLLPDADAKRVMLTRADGTTTIVDLNKLGPTPLVTAGSKISVEKFDAARYVTVKGAVQAPGAMAYRPGMSAKDAIAAATMFGEAKADSVKISRSTGKVQEVKMADLQAVALQPGDTVEVSYNNRAVFTDNELLTILLIVVIIVLIAR